MSTGDILYSTIWKNFSLNSLESYIDSGFQHSIRCGTLVWRRSFGEIFVNERLSETIKRQMGVSSLSMSRFFFYWSERRIDGEAIVFCGIRQAKNLDSSRHCRGNWRSSPSDFERIESIWSDDPFNQWCEWRENRFHISTENPINDLPHSLSWGPNMECKKQVWSGEMHQMFFVRENIEMNAKKNWSKIGRNNR